MVNVFSNIGVWRFHPRLSFAVLNTWTRDYLKAVDFNVTISDFTVVSMSIRESISELDSNLASVLNQSDNHNDSNDEFSVPPVDSEPALGFEICRWKSQICSRGDNEHDSPNSHCSEDSD